MARVYERRNKAMQETSEQAGLDTAHAFIEAFNAQDHNALAQTLNYPHIRLANGKFHRVETAQAFVDHSTKHKPSLLAEGWHHSVVRDATVVHCGHDKVHLSLSIDRCHADGHVYNTFDTFWVATLLDGHWGIQFRSSFLRHLTAQTAPPI